MKIELKDQDVGFEANKGTILDAALAASIPWPHQCRSGECGHCRCRLIEGDVRRDPYLPGTLSVEEERSGVILACRSTPKTPLVLGLDGPLPPAIRSIEAKIQKRAFLSSDVIRLVLEPKERVDFLPGQYADVCLPGMPARAYSMASAPAEPELDFLVKIVGNGCVSPALADAELGTVLKLRMPLGAAHWQNSARPLLLIGSGTGLAPLMSIWRHVSSCSAKTPAELIAIHADWARDLFEPPSRQHWLADNGMLDQIDGEMQDLKGYDCHFAGSPATMKLVKSLVFTRGLPAERFFADPFWTPELIVKPALGQRFGQIMRKLFAA